MAASEEDEMKNEIKCLRCGGEMELIRKEYLQLGKTGWFIGDWGNLLAGALWVNIMACPRCGKLEFFRGDGIRGVYGWFSTSQWISIGLLAVALIYGLWIRKKLQNKTQAE